MILKVSWSRGILCKPEFVNSHIRNINMSEQMEFHQAQ
jgi:hypothetical protein